ncbi:ribonuclease D [Aldersonia sp. NBC_00410]|uniref:ribonuclease D n=1 Tax=Aldersonia sp. NBC_00410 TaxID=2975954 RepID=UPI00224F69E6|nr:ribonuclease D [Aldersonia sp. NBC_00410]MCX5042549.1 ribonuclease D [Aldersonia sp. NBC_00410]
MPDSSETTAEQAAPEVPTPLLTPAEGVPPVVESSAGLRDAVARLAAGHGPLAVDAERASGFRYSNRAYLVQLRRAGSGTVLLDPIPLTGDLTPLAEVINPLEWVLHAADQDLPGLAEIGLRPAALYDTELGGRLAGLDRVGLAAMVEHLLGLELRKGHGAADWSRRPLPHDWLNYAALDVEVLLELRGEVARILDEQGKTAWAAEEFEYVRTRPAAAPKPDRWRRTSQIHTLKSPRQLAVVRELWTARDELAAERDIAPGRVLPDAAIVSAATTDPKSVADLRRLPIFGGPRQRRSSRHWMDAIEAAQMLPTSELPRVSQPPDGPPQANRWAKRDPEAAARLTAARAVMTEIGERLSIPVENLLSPELLRRLCWDGVDTTSPTLAADIDAFLAAGAARAWQRELTVAGLSAALTASTERNRSVDQVD